LKRSRCKRNLGVSPVVEKEIEERNLREGDCHNCAKNERLKKLHTKKNGLKTEEILGFTRGEKKRRSGKGQANVCILPPGS